MQPYALKEFKGRWYLLAMEVGDKGKMKAWGLDRISDLQMTRELFDKDPAFAVGRSYQDCFGIFVRDDIPTEKVVLSFDPVGGSYIETFRCTRPGNRPENRNGNTHSAAREGDL